MRFRETRRFFAVVAVPVLLLAIGAAIIFGLGALVSWIYGVRLGPAVFSVALGVIPLWAMVAYKDRQWSTAAQAVQILAVLAGFIADGAWMEGTPFFTAVGQGVVGSLALAGFMWCCWWVVSWRDRESV